MIGLDWIACLLMTAAGFDMIQNHVDLLSGKVHAVPTLATATAADTAEIIRDRDVCLRSGAGFPDVLVVDHDAKFTSEVFLAFVKSMGSSLIVGLAYHKNTNAKVERAKRVMGDTLRAYANGRKDDWDKQLQFAEFAINNTALTLCWEADMTPFFIEQDAHPRLPHYCTPITPRMSHRTNICKFGGSVHRLETTPKKGDGWRPTRSSSSYPEAAQPDPMVSWVLAQDKEEGHPGPGCRHLPCEGFWAISKAP